MWKTRKIKLTMASTAESEYVALYYAGLESKHMSNVLKELFGIDIKPVIIYCDNKSVVEVLNRTKEEV